VASASAGISFLEKSFFTFAGVGQKLKFARFLSKIPELLQLPAFAAGSVGPDPHPGMEGVVLAVDSAV
jgi:hypothetical protein